MNPAPPASNRILVVDDELGPRVRRLCARAGGLPGHPGGEREEAEGQISDDSFDLLILDIMMPGSGLDLCREVRAHSPVPIILLTTRTRRSTRWWDSRSVPTTTSPSRSRCASCSAGSGHSCAAASSTAQPVPRGAAIETGPVSIDLARHLVTVRGEPINLTRSEFQAQAAGREPRPGLLAEGDHGGALADGFRGDVRACDVHISNLRQKVESDPQNPELVLTVRRVGYRFAEHAT